MKSVNTKTEQKDGFRIFWLVWAETIVYGLMFAIAAVTSVWIALLFIGLPFLIVLHKNQARLGKYDSWDVPETVAEEFKSQPKPPKTETPKQRQLIPAVQS